MAARNLAQRLAHLLPSPSLPAGLDERGLREPRKVRASIIVTRLVNYEEVASSSDLSRLPEVLRTYLRGLEEAAAEHHGSIDTLLGARAVLTFGLFGHGDSAPDDAVDAALRLLGRERDSLQTRLASYHPRLGLAVGVASGEALLAEIEGEWRSFSGCYGGPVERALALCDLAKAGELVADEATCSAAGVDSRQAQSVGKNGEGRSLYRIDAGDRSRSTSNE